MLLIQCLNIGLQIITVIVVFGLAFKFSLWLSKITGWPIKHGLNCFFIVLGAIITLIYSYLGFPSIR